MPDCDGTGPRDERCADEGSRECRQRGTSDCRREGGRGRGDGSCRRGNEGNAAVRTAASSVPGPAPTSLTRIAVCASGPTLADRVHERFGRAECFQIVDSATMTTQVIANDENRAGAEGVGIGAVELLAEHGAQAAIVTKVGPKAADAFRRAGISVYEGTDLTVGQAVAAYLRGELTSLDHG